MTSADVTRKALSLGSADTVTGRYAKSYADSTIQVLTSDAQAARSLHAAGNFSTNSLTVFTEDPLLIGDIIVHPNGDYYEVENTREVWYLDSFVFRECRCSRLPTDFGATPAAYGTEATVPDARSRSKVYIDAYLLAANIKKSNGSTNAATHVQFSKPPYSLERVFGNTDSKNLYAVYSIGVPESEPKVDYAGRIIGYTENVPIEIQAVDKSDASGENTRWQCERELRRIVETNPVSTSVDGLTGTSYHSLNRITDSESESNLGVWRLYSVKYVLTWWRDIT